ncbi:MAG: hypothetical protein Q7S74_04140 [Nanoarchaeota archaeon]|nr:hypothetical protein [Nanoarchaeota archaeon]
MKQEQPVLFCIKRIREKTDITSISSEDENMGHFRKQYDALVNSSSELLKEVKKLEGIVYPQFLSHLEKGEIRVTSGINLCTAHADYPIKCPRTNFRNLAGYSGRLSSVFGSSVEQMVYNEMYDRSQDESFRSKIKLPKIKAPEAPVGCNPFEYNPERWKEWVMTIHFHDSLPHIELDFWIGSR